MSFGLHFKFNLNLQDAESSHVSISREYMNVEEMSLREGSPLITSEYRTITEVGMKDPPSAEQLEAERLSQ